MFKTTISLIKNIIKLRDKFRLKTFTYENLIKKDATLFERSEDVNGSHNHEDPTLKDFILIKSPPVKVDFLITSEPSGKNIADYLQVLLKLKPIAIISLSSYVINFD
jgi:hypothetical protein